MYFIINSSVVRGIDYYSWMETGLSILSVSFLCFGNGTTLHRDNYLTKYVDKNCVFIDIFTLY